MAPRLFAALLVVAKAVGSTEDIAAALEADDVCRTETCALELAQLRAAVRPGAAGHGVTHLEPAVAFQHAADEFQQKHASLQALSRRATMQTIDLETEETARLCAGLNFSTSIVSHSNLGGQGPDDGAETLVYQNIAVKNGVPVDLVVTTSGAYVPNAATKNGLYLGVFGIVNLKVNNAVDLTFRFVDRQGGPVTMDPFFWTFYDIDQGMDHASRRAVTVRGFTEYRVAEESELRIEVLGDDSASFRSSLRGGKVDNPSHPMALTGTEKERTVVVKFPALSEFSVSLDESNYADVNQGRNFLFSGPSSMVCGREHMCTDYVCPSGYHIRTMAEFLVCAGRRCGNSDRDTCCYEIPPGVTPPE